MISLKIKDYCHNCEEFEAEVEKLNRGLTFHDTIITCAHECRCQQIKNYLEKGSEKNEPPVMSRLKTPDLCESCKYGVETCNVRCSDCELSEANGCICKCNDINYGKPCPYYKPNT